MSMRQLKITKSITNRESQSLEKYLQEIGKVELISSDEEVRLAALIRQGCQKSLDRLTKANLRFVVSVAKQYQNQGLSLPDLINEGNLGLIKAAQRFDETRGFKFISYAVWWIRQSILQALAEQSRIVRLPLNKVGLTNKVQKAFSQLEQQFEREPSAEELAELLEMDLDEVSASLSISSRHVSMDTPISEGEDGTLLDVLENPNAVKEARSKNKNVVIIDTAGRLAIDEVMMTEVANIRNAVNPQEILFVVDSMTGQDAVNTAKAFNDRLDFTGVVLTKLDGDTRGGAAISIKYTVNKPIKFTSAGEKMDTLDVFYPDRMAQRILGMGDITSLVEKAQEQFDEEQAKKLEGKIRKNKFDFADFKMQLEQIKKMGNMKDLLAMVPGVGSKIKDLDIDNDSFKGIEAMINSMTPAERADPDLIDGSRRKRIAKGAGKDISEVNAFMKQFEQMRDMMKGMNKMGMFGKMMPGMRR